MFSLAKPVLRRMVRPSLLPFSRPYRHLRSYGSSGESIKPALNVITNANAMKYGSIEFDPHFDFCYEVCRKDEQQPFSVGRILGTSLDGVPLKSVLLNDDVPQVKDFIISTTACIAKLDSTIFAIQRDANQHSECIEYLELPEELLDKFYQFLSDHKMGRSADLEFSFHAKQLLLYSKRKIRPRATVMHPSPWSRPGENRFKLNFDGSWLSSTGGGGIGWVIRDHFGSVCIAGAHQRNAESSEENEVAALKEGLQAALSRGYLDLEVEGDCMDVIDRLQLGECLWSNINVINLMQDCIFLKSRFKRIDFIYASRGCNTIADSFALWGRGRKGSDPEFVGFWEDCPPWLLKYVKMDIKLSEPKKIESEEIKSDTKKLQ